jgi:hypothetical protein
MRAQLSGKVRRLNCGAISRSTPKMEESTFSLDDDLKHLAPEDLGRVRRWVEDKFVNAVCPLVVRLRLAMPEGVHSDHTLLAAQVAVDRILAAVEEVRRMDGDTAF